MYRKFLLVAAAAFGGLMMSSSVSSQDVKYYWDAGTNFSAYKTYKWERANDAKYPDSTTDAILTKAIDGELSKKGLVRTDADTADLYIIYQLAVVDRAEWSSFSTDITWQGGVNSFGGFNGATTNHSTMIKLGWLILDIYDTKQKKEIWEAQASKTMGKTKDPRKMSKNAEKAMAKVFKQYPPTGK